MLCYAMLCYAMLCYAMLCYATLSYPILSYPILSYPILSYPIVYDTLQYNTSATPLPPQHRVGLGETPCTMTWSGGREHQPWAIYIYVYLMSSKIFKPVSPQFYLNLLTSDRSSKGSTISLQTCGAVESSCAEDRRENRIQH